MIPVDAPMAPSPQVVLYRGKLFPGGAWVKEGTAMRKFAARLEARAEQLLPLVAHYQHLLLHPVPHHVRVDPPERKVDLELLTHQPLSRRAQSRRSKSDRRSGRKGDRKGGRQGRRGQGDRSRSPRNRR